MIKKIQVKNIISALIIISIYVKCRKRYLRKRKAIKIVTQELARRDKLISQIDKESKGLRIRINKSFDEIIDLAKLNHPNFYTRFQEVYPDFQKKLLSINPNLKNSELVLLSYIYLDFKTKEIADYTFKSPKTIQNRKHLLRKKLDIPASVDISVWLKFDSN